MRREERLDFISRLITTKEVQTQDELVQELLANDNDVTHATVSRDIKSLALIKIPGSRGGYRYALPQQHDEEQKSRTSNYGRIINSKNRKSLFRTFGRGFFY